LTVASRNHRVIDGAVHNDRGTGAAFQADQADATLAPQLIDDVVSRFGGSRAGRPGFADYAATKAGLIGYTRGAARDLARRGITVNIVQAGLVATQMVPPSPEVLKAMVSGLAIQRVRDPAETAAVITFLASPGASYITGALIDSNGGYTA
jgi:NAD(P)-dependent dehydrogenase (short-subunit alcohol dehydrogenase family)